MNTIAISGSNGKMGQMIATFCENSQIPVGAFLSRGDDLEAIKDSFDVLIDFTRPEATLKYLEFCKTHHKGIVIGTTGFSDTQLQYIDSTSQHIPIVFAPNMSIGINVILELLALTAKTVGKHSDIEIVEAHHRYKVDAPSGTALQMGEVIANALGRDLKECAVYERHGVNEVRKEGTIGFSTIRGGNIVGEHKVYFFLQGEHIELTHKATSRHTFANGAITAVKWLEGKNSGLYSMRDVLQIPS